MDKHIIVIDCTAKPPEGTKESQPDCHEEFQAQSTDVNPPETLQEHGKEIYADVASWEWDRFLLEGHEALISHDIVNHKRSRLLVISGTDTENISGEDEEILTALTKATLKSQSSLQRDKEKVRLLKLTPKAYKMQFKLIDLGEHFPNPENMPGKEFKERKQKMFQDIQNFKPTAVVLPFTAAKFPSNIDCGVDTLDITKSINNLNVESKLDGMAGIIGADIVNLLRKTKPYLWQNDGVVVANKNCLIFRIKNMFQTNKTLLTSNTRTGITGLTESILNILDFLKRFSVAERITVLIISGCHGHLTDGFSGFTKEELLDDKLYEDVCKLVGLKADDRNSSTTPMLKAQKIYIDAEDDSLLRQPPYRNIKFNILNIKFFHQNANGLLDYVEQLNPSAIILDWCFAKNGDVANLLTKSGIVAKMWLRFERTSIVGMTGKGFIELSKEQTETLRDVAKQIEEGSLNGVILAGAHGSGKTLLGCEVSKIKMAQLKNDKEEFDLHAVDCADGDDARNTPYKGVTLLHLLKNNFFVEEDSPNKKYFYTRKKIKLISGKWIFTSFKDIMLSLQEMFKQQQNSSDRKNIIFLDEVPARFFFKDRFFDEAFDFKWDPNIFVVCCISPTIDQDETDFKEKLENIDKKNFLDPKNIIFKKLSVTYRNSLAIQMFYNVFLAHYTQWSKHYDILTGMMQQPQISTKASYSDHDGNGTNLPLGPKPTFFITKADPRDLSDDELKILEEKVLEKIVGQESSLSALCNGHNKEECSFC